MKYIRIIALLIFLTSCINNDSPFGEGVSFLKYYGDGNSNIGIKVIGLEGEGYILGGYTSIADSSVQADLIRVDLLGNKIWEMVVAPDTNSQVLQDLIVNAEGDYLLLSTVVKGNGVVGSRQDFRITKVSSSGELEWFREFGNDAVTPRNDQASAIIQTADGGYAMIGTTQTSATNSDLFIVRTDADGNKIWDKVYGSSGALNDEGNDILELPNGNLVWFGTRQISTNRSRIRMVIANSIGNLIDDVDYQPKDGTETIVSTTASAGEIILEDNSLFMTGSVAGYFVALSTDLSGRLKWEVAIDNNPTADEVGSGLSKTKDGNLIAVGRTNVEGRQNDIYMLNLSVFGGENWERTYGVSGTESASSVASAQDGGYVVFGTVNLNNSNQMMMLMKTDKNGDLAEE